MVLITARDIIAMGVLSACFWLIAHGSNGVVTAITTAIIGYYFSKRVYEEKNGSKLAKIN